MSEQKYTGVYKQKNGNWAYRFVVFVDGKRIEKKKSRNEEGRPFKTARQAWQARQKAMQEYKVEQVLMATVKPIERKRVKEVYEEYCATGRNDKAYTTIVKQNKLWNNHLLERFGSKYIDDIRVADVQDYLAELYCVRNYSYGYVEGFLKQFYLIFGQAYSRNYLSVNDYNKLCVNKNTKIKMPAKRSTDIKDIEVYSDEQLAMLDEYFKGTVVETGYMIGRYTGLRISECYGLTWNMVNLEEGYISVERQLQTNGGIVRLASLKTVNARRKVYIGAVLKDYLLGLKERTEKHKKEYFVQRKQNEKVVYDDIEGEISSLELINTLPNGMLQTIHAIRHHRRNIIDRYNIEFKYHTLRHTYGTKLALMNTPEHILLNQMGHSKSITTHKYYLAMSEEGINELRSNLERL